MTMFGDRNALVWSMIALMCCALVAQVEAASTTKVALVTLSVNDYGGVLEGGGSSDAAELVSANMRKMVELTEERLARDWSVVKAASFVANDAFRELSIGQIKDGLFGAELDGLVLPSFTAERKEIIKCVLSKATAQKLCEVLGVDVVMVVYSEWAVATGTWAPTNKALAKNCVAAYDASGKQLFFGRKDVMGKRTLGAMGSFAIDENTISEWVMSYQEGLNAVLKKFGKKIP
jgi:hypothetical protein